jgi:hypothetical protein
MGNKIEKGDKSENSNLNKKSNFNSPQKNTRKLSSTSEGKLRQKEGLYSEEKILENFESK